MRRLIVLAGVVVTASLLMTGCEYDVAQPHWNDEFVEPATPEITQIMPADAAPPGANTITIIGNHFAEGTDRNRVYFDRVPAEVITASPTSISVRRPNLVSEACEVRVVSFDALEVAKSGPYRVDSVWDEVGLFPENLALNAVTVDHNENVYVFQHSPRTIYKISPDGQMTELGTTSRAVTDAKYARIGGEETIIILNTNRSIQMLNLSTLEETEWIRITGRVSYGDFDRHGNFYAAGSRTDLQTVTADLREKPRPGMYSADDIHAVRVFQDHVYLAVTLARPADGEPVTGIWRHEIQDAEGNLGPRKLVLDWSTTGAFAESAINDIAFSQDGILYVATDHDNPVLMMHPDERIDVLYKEILPSYPVKCQWGTGNSFYMVLGGEERIAVRVDAGVPGAPYFGRSL